ncbi:MAG: cobalamin B12-binding domain-containing protein [Ideonella sp.]|nr:cobalamin B12-binding domain-containing protein [Ideonella sp.]
MAGWKNERLQASPAHPAVLLEAGCDADNAEVLRQVPQSIGEMMARVGRDLQRERTSLVVAAERLRATGPHLVSDNATPELQLSRIVELEIIPRLMLLHGGAPLSKPPPQQFMAITAAHVETLTQLAVDADPARAGQFVTALLLAGAEPEAIFLHLLAPSAKLMGVLWTDDVYTFSQVTIGLWRLQQVLHEQSQRFNANYSDPECPKALLAAVPGSQHTFGVSMLCEFFARGGWHVRCEPQSNWDDMLETLASDRYDMLGLSVSVDTSLPSITSAIIKMRQASCNSQLFVMVGGPSARDMPDLAERCGADAMAMDATGALDLANRRLGPARLAAARRSSV